VGCEHRAALMPAPIQSVAGPDHQLDPRIPPSRRCETLRARAGGPREVARYVGRPWRDRVGEGIFWGDAGWLGDIWLT
jgi:hypothetical protein